MNYKELMPQEVAKMLNENPNGFDGYVRDNDKANWISTTITGVMYNEECFPFINIKGRNWRYCAISIPDTYEPYPDDEMPNLKRLDGVIWVKTGMEETVISCDKRETEKSHICLSSSGWVTNDNLFSLYTHLDGSPIGRKVGE